MAIYYYSIKGNKTGPVTLDQLKQLSLNENTLVWKEGLSGWIKAKELPELNGAILREPPLLPNEKKQKDNEEYLNLIKKSILKSIFSHKLWTRYLIISTVLTIIIVIGGMIDDGNDSIFPVYKTNWERKHPAFSIIKSSFFLFLYSGIATILIGLIQGLTYSRLRGKDDNSQNKKGNSVSGESILAVCLLLLIIAYCTLYKQSIKIAF